MTIRETIRKLIYTPFKSPDDLWRKRTRWGEMNEFFKLPIIASDIHGYNPPFIANPFSTINALNKWTKQNDSVNEQIIQAYDYNQASAERSEWGRGIFNLIYQMIEKRVNKDDVILDCGCSSGSQLEMFHDKGFTNLWGLDPMTAAIEYGRKTRPYINFVEGTFGPKENDVTCDLMVWFGSLSRVPYGDRFFNAVDRCVTKYIAISCQESVDDFVRDYHIGLGKKGFICIEKHVVTEGPARDRSENAFIPIDHEGAEGPLIELGSREKGTDTQKLFRSLFLFRRIEPRPPAPKNNVRS